MKRILVILVVCLAVVMPITAAEPVSDVGDISVGLALGVPSGVSAKYVFDDNISFDAVVGYGLSAKPVVLRTDALYGFDKFTIGTVDLYPYVGGGLNVGFFNGFSFGIDVPAGISYHFDNPAVEIFLEVVPGITVIPFDFSFSGGIGARYTLDL